tara:strand:+ start:2684 stop:3520 length:837 start_codon:yes stop_codon:yes gene_type:complete
MSSLKRYFDEIPESLFDEILQFNEINEIIKFSLTSVYNKNVVGKITNNNCTKIQILYEQKSSIIDIETWLFCSKKLYKTKNIKQFRLIYQNYNGMLIQEFYRVFTSLTSLYEEISISKMREEKQVINSHSDLIHTLFYIVKNNISLFTDFDLSEKNINYLSYILGFLNNMYCSENTLNRINLLSIIKKIYYDLFTFIKDYDDIEECYMCDIIQDIMFDDSFRRKDNAKHMNDITNFLDDAVLDFRLDYYFLSTLVEDGHFREDGADSDGCYFFEYNNY